MKISQIYRLLSEGKSKKQLEAEAKAKAEAKIKAEELRALEIENRGMTMQEKIQNIIKKLQNLLQISGIGEESEISAVSLDTIEYLISTQNKVINDTIDKLGEMNIEPITYTKNGNINKSKSHNSDIREIISNMLSYQGYQDNILSELNAFFAERDTKGITTNDFPINQVFNIDSIISNKTGLNTNVIKKLSNIKGSAGVTRGLYEVALTICSKNGKLGAESNKKNVNTSPTKGDIIINGKGIEVKAAAGDDATNGGKLAGQKNKANVRDIISYANNIIVNFTKSINKILKTKVSSTQGDGFVFFVLPAEKTTKERKYFTFDSYLTKILLDAINTLEAEPTQEQKNEIVKLFKNSYISLMHNFIDTAAVDEIINSITTSATFESIAENGFLTNDMYHKFSRYFGALHMIYYHQVEPWDGIIVINTLTGNAVYVPGNIVASNSNPISLASTLDENIEFSVPDMRPGASRQVIAGVICTA